MLSPRSRRNIFRIIPFGIMWMAFSVVYALMERGLLGKLNYYPSTGNPYFFERNIIMIPLAAFVTGSAMGALEVFYFNRWFINQSFTKKIVFKACIYLVIILAFLLITFVGTSDDMVLTYVRAFFTNYSLLSVTIYIAAIILVTQFYSEVSDSIGHSALRNFFLGKYHRPIQEERVFMFLDMRSSTTIAERLGHVKYFEMLKTYFADLSGPVIDYGGEIYQYAGDEMIISWKFNHAVINGNCIRCFFAMKQALIARAAKYNSSFGLLPVFKAGLHCGMVTAGEIGVLKKEIIFTGDVLNATARIQSLCNALDVDILVSGPLVKHFEHTSFFRVISLDTHELKGREEKMALFTVNLISD